jgi:hypothetical protein
MACETGRTWPARSAWRGMREKVVIRFEKRVAAGF